MAKKTTPGFEERIRRLEDIIQELERADLPLERNVALYKEGCVLAASCREMLERARHEITLCREGEDEIPFAARAGQPDPTAGPELPAELDPTLEPGPDGDKKP